MELTELTTQQTGTRIRERRLDQGLRQADLASEVGISASYLNLIEHNKRRIAGRLLSDIAKALKTEAALLNEGVDQVTLNQMHTAAAASDHAVELDRTAELAARYPGWAGLVAAQSQRITALEVRLQEVSDRMTHDPALATSLHSVISAVTSIRSTASILTSDEDLDADWQQRFQRNIHSDAIRLAENSDALMTYLEAPTEGGTQNTPTQEAEGYLNARGFHVAALESSAKNVMQLVEKSELSEDGKDVLRRFYDVYARDAARLPLKAFVEKAEEFAYDPLRLSLHFTTPLPSIFRRLASLPEGHPPFGVVQIDAAGVQGISKPVAGMIISRGGACPLWPVFTALGQPGRPVQAMVAMPGSPQARALCYAIAEQDTYGMQAVPLVSATALIVPDPADQYGDVIPIGPTCRICPRSDCAARREPSVLKEQA